MLIVPAHAKLNLSLEVVGRRDDGFHDLDSVVVPLDWHDLVGVRIGAAATAVRVTGPNADAVPAGENDLTHRAAVAAAEVVGQPVEVWLEKRLPAGGGLGGGSADAASVLAAVERLTGTAMAHLAAALGSDVPVQLSGRPSRIEGRGERLTPFAAPGLWVAVAFAGHGDTAAAYMGLEGGEVAAGTRATALIGELAQGRAPDALLGSALEASALRASPDLADAVTRLRAKVAAVTWHMTGSGGCLFAVCDSPAAARQIAGAAQQAGFNARACRTLT